jgi:dUTP diphosphatase
MDNNMVSVVLAEGASLPTRGSVEAAGYDLYSNENGVIQPNGRFLVKTGVTMELKKGTYGRIAPRSGLAFNYGIDVLAGVIDSDYRGEIGVIIYNTGNKPFIFYKTDRIAQIIITPILTPQLKVVDKLDKTDRNEGAYGSTG